MNIPDEVIQGRDDLLRDLQRAAGKNETWAWNVWNLIGTSRWRIAHDEAVRKEALREAAAAIEAPYLSAGRYDGKVISAVAEAARAVRALAERGL